MVPGSGPISDFEEAKAFARDIGYPVLVKASAGGGGRGMKLALVENELEPALATARNEATRRLRRRHRLSREISRPSPPYRGAGAGRRRRATPSISASATARCSGGIRSSGRRRPRRRSTRASACASARPWPRPCAQLGYRGVGTVEFLYEDGEFYFIEMNTRLQVEHTITEMITGLDLVIEQIRIAAGAPLTLRQEDIRFNGHAIECRINAENPHTFRPSPGTITHFHPPGGLGVRVDSGAYAGYTIPPYYDSLIGKLIVHARTRNECLMRLKRALGEFVVDGIETTIPLFTSLIAEPDIVDGNYDIHWLENHLAKARTAADRPAMTSIDDVMIEITPQVLLKAYACGIFPMAESAEDNALYWIEPERRGILPLDHVHVPQAARPHHPQRRLRGQDRQRSSRR